MPHGSFVWYELMTTDTTAAKFFYGSVMGWGAQNADQPSMEYTMLTVGEVPAAGLMALPEEARKMGGRTGWVGYVAVDDLEKSTAEVKDLGGTIHRPPSDIPGVGRFAIVSDPQGPVIALFKGNPGMDGLSVAPKTTGYAGWRELMAGDRETAFAFYSKMFGWTKGISFDMGTMGLYQIFDINGVQSGAMMTRPPTVPVPFWGYYFYVDGIDAAADRIKTGGGQVLNGPMQVPDAEWVIQALDPQGGFFGLVSKTK